MLTTLIPSPTDVDSSVAAGTMAGQDNAKGPTTPLADAKRTGLGLGVLGGLAGSSVSGLAPPALHVENAFRGLLSPSTPRSLDLYRGALSSDPPRPEGEDDEDAADSDDEPLFGDDRGLLHTGALAAGSASARDAPLHPLNSLFSAGLSLSGSLGAAALPAPVSPSAPSASDQTRLPDARDFERNKILRGNKSPSVAAGAKRRSPMTGSPEPPAKATPFLKPAKQLPSMERIRQQTMQRSQSEGSGLGIGPDGVPRITPDKVARPTPRAFHSTGLLTKRTGKRLSTVSLPDTPSKRNGGAASEGSSTGNNWMFTSSDSAYGSGLHSENESPVSSTKSMKSRTPLNESPLFPHTRDLSLIPDVNNGEMSPVSPPHPVQFARHPFFAGHRTSGGGTLMLPDRDEMDNDVNMNSPTDRSGSGQPSSFEERDWFSANRDEDSLNPMMLTPSLGGSRQPSELSFTTSLSEMSDIRGDDSTLADDADEANWRRASSQSTDRRGDISKQPPPGPELVFTPYPRFLNPEQYDFETGLEKPGAAEERWGDTDYFSDAFVVIRQLGRGSSADAFKVQSRADPKPFAIKRTRHPYNGHKDRTKHLIEVDVMWTVGAHQHCVQLLNAWEQRGHLYLQMELCAGGSLQSYLDQFSGDFDELKVWRTLGDIAQGLEHIHGCEVIHLDIKPANIFITQNWKLKIGDFGMATKLPVKGNVEREGDRIYIAKEILSSHYGKPADIFSLGIMMLEIAANVVLPHFGDDWHKLRNGDFSVVSFGNASLVLQKMIKGMMDPNPDARPTASEITKHPLIGCWF